MRDGRYQPSGVAEALAMLDRTTTTATSPDRTRTLHSHGPPSQAA